MTVRACFVATGDRPAVVSLAIDRLLNGEAVLGKIGFGSRELDLPGLAATSDFHFDFAQNEIAMVRSAGSADFLVRNRLQLKVRNAGRSRFKAESISVLVRILSRNAKRSIIQARDFYVGKGIAFHRRG